MYDVVIIGAGVAGAAVARELSRYQIKACVLEQAEDVCCGTSKANSGIVHAGFDAKHGSLKARMNVAGNRMMAQMAEELEFEFVRNGSLVLAFTEEDKKKIKELYDNGVRNGVENLQILNAEQVLAMEPHVSKDVMGALYAPSGGIVCPFGMNIAYAENAYTNDVEFFFHTQVLGVECDRHPDSHVTEAKERIYTIHTNQGDYHTRCMVNAAGVYADEIHNMVSEEKLHITARRGDYCLLDKIADEVCGCTLFQAPSERGKGVLITPTVHGNVLVGPTAIPIEDKEATATTQTGIDELILRANRSVPNLPMRQVITSFAGLRATENGRDFILQEIADAPGVFDVAGIESPGLSSAPAIGVYMAQLIQDKYHFAKKEDFEPRRKGMIRTRNLTVEQHNALIQENPAYGNVVCRCEMITEGEIVDAIRRPLGATTIDGIKRRTRAGMGRCQTGFCLPKQIDILARECQISVDEVCKSGSDSTYIIGRNKDIQ